jgi:hypothetical protein
MKLEEIFKKNPELLKDEEVQNLVKYCEAVFKKQLAKMDEYKAFHDKVVEELMYSELILKSGNKSTEALRNILTLSNETPTL